MPTRRELIERVTMRMRARGGEGRVESSLCFLRALLVGVAEDAPVPAAVLSRVGELKRLDAKLNGLWDELRAVRARLRFGDRDAIVARARVEERLERAA